MSSQFRSLASNLEYLEKDVLSAPNLIDMSYAAEVADLRSPQEVQDYANMLVYGLDDDFENNPFGMDLSTAVSLFFPLLDMLEFRPELRLGIEVEYIAKFAKALINAGDYGDIIGLLMYIKDDERLCEGVSSAQVAQAADACLEEVFSSLDDEDDDSDVLETEEFSEEPSEEFLALMGIVCDVPEWCSDIRPEVFVKESTMLSQDFDLLVRNKLWSKFVDMLDDNRHRPALLEEIAAYHIPAVVGGLISSREPDVFFYIANLLDIIAHNAPSLGDYISSEQYSHMNQVVLKKGAQAIKEDAYDTYRSLLCVTRELPELYDQLTNNELMNGLATRLNTKFAISSDTAKATDFLLNLKTYHMPVFEKLSTIAKGTLFRSGNEFSAGGPTNSF